MIQFVHYKNLRTVIYKWCETNYETFKDILLGFQKGEDFSKGKVIEIQDPLAILTDNRKHRIFFGKDINIFEWEDYNKDPCKKLRELNKETGGLVMEDLKGPGAFSICNLDPTLGPIISPIRYGNSFGIGIHLFHRFGDVEYQEDFERTPLKDDFPRSVWYLKKDGYILVDLRKKVIGKYPDSERMIRYRSIDLKDWKEITRSWINGQFATEFMAEDLDPNKIEVKYDPEIFEKRKE